MKPWEWIASWHEPLGWFLTVVAASAIVAWWLPSRWSPRRRFLLPFLALCSASGALATWVLHQRASAAVSLAEAPGSRLMWQGNILWILGPTESDALVHGLLGTQQATRMGAMTPSIGLTVRQARALARSVPTSGTWKERLASSLP